MNAGETFHAASPGSWRKHLWIAVTDPDANGELVIANITSQASNKDQSCILDVGDHPFISKQSVVNYAEACITSDEDIRRAARGGAIQLDVPVTGGALAKVQAGALTSAQIEPKVKAVVQAALLQA